MKTAAAAYRVHSYSICSTWMSHTRCLELLLQIRTVNAAVAEQIGKIILHDLAIFHAKVIWPCPSETGQTQCNVIFGNGFTLHQGKGSSWGWETMNDSNMSKLLQEVNMGHSWFGRQPTAWPLELAHQPNCIPPRL